MFKLMRADGSVVEMPPEIMAAVMKSPWRDQIGVQLPMSICAKAMVRPDTGDLLAIGGIIHAWPGMGHAWTYIREDRTRKEIVQLTEQVRDSIVRAHTQFGMVRIQCDVKADHAAGHRWARTLGFTPEGTMRRYKDGHDYVLYARIMET